MEVLTADRVVGQTITEHPLAGYVPTISFLGTRFENLRIAGYPVELEFDHDIFGPKPLDDAPYTQDAGFISRVARQYDRIGSRQGPSRGARRNGTIDYPPLLANRRRSNVRWSTRRLAATLGKPLGTSSGFPASGSSPWPS